VDLQAPLLIRRIDTSELGPFTQQTTENLGLAGVYFETDDGTFEVNEVVMTSVSIPESERRAFPFTRLAGQGRVVRVNELSGNGGAQAGGRKKYGIALEFGNDLTALTSIPSRG
jgi:hypothetical protein